MSSYQDTELKRPSVTQKLIWRDQAFNCNSPKYNIGGYALLQGPLCAATLEASIVQVLKSQQVYSSVFEEKEGELFYTVQDAAPAYRLARLDCSAEPDPMAAAKQWMDQEFGQCFELENRHLFTFQLLKLDAETHLWYAKIHHLIGDGWSFSLLLNAMAAFYRSLRETGAAEYTCYSYEHYIQDDQAYYLSQQAADDRAYWMQQFQGYTSLLHQKNTISYARKAASKTLALPKETYNGLKEAADRHGVSVFQLILGSLLLYFGNTQQQSTVAIGMPVLNRTNKLFKQTAGVFMNLLAVRFTLDEDASLATLLSGVKQKMRETLRHQRYQYGNLVKDLARQGERAGLYDIRVSYEEFDFTSSFGDVRSSAFALSNYWEEDPLSIYVRGYHDDGVDIRFVFNQQYFAAEEIDLLIRRLQTIFRIFSADTSALVRHVSLVDAEEQRLLEAAAVGPVRPREQDSFVALWQAGLATHANRIAISSPGAQLTYQQVNERAVAVAHELTRWGLQPGDTVALLLERSEWMVVGMLASMLAGVTYLPLDPAYPETLLRYMLENAECKLVLSGSRLPVPWLPPVECLAVDACPPAADAAGQLLPLPGAGSMPHTPCYIIYTSGSTGNPKGVVISHGALLDYALSFTEYFNVTAQDVVLQQASISFDTSVEEIFPVLAAGGRLHILPAPKDLDALSATLEQEGVTLLSTNPYVIAYLNTQELPASLRVLISGGDVLKPEYISRVVGQPVALYNTYGPTESTVCATYHKVERLEPNIPIGTPLYNREVYVLNEARQVQPVGQEGELYIGGAGLAEGYLRQPELTQEKFVPHPFQPGQKLYRTGDVGCLQPDGTLLFKGRIDNQLSFRGYRLEAHYIESAINAQQPGLDSIVAVRHLQGHPMLVAFVQSPRPLAYTLPDWRRLLSTSLPAHMIPEVWVQLEAFPLLPNGKVNRKALPEIHAGMLAAESRPTVAPQNALEEKLCQLWSEVLNQPAVGVLDSFFELGGHSLNVIQLLGRLRTECNVSLQLQDIFTHPTIRELAPLLVSTRPALAPLPISPHHGPAAARYPLTHAQQRMWLVSQAEEVSRAYHISGALRLQGEVNAAWTAETLRDMVSRHEALRTVFQEDSTGEVYQQVLAPEEVAPNVLTCYDLSTEPDEAARHTLLREVLYRPFELTTGPLLRAALITLAPADYLLVYVMHHIISDGWSVEVLFREFMAGYRARAAGQPAALPALPIQFRDYVRWARQQEQTPQPADEAYWLGKFAEKAPVLDLPTQHPRPSARTFSGAEVVLPLAGELQQRLQAVCEAEGATLFMGLFALLNATLFRYTGQECTVIGTPLANREQPELQQQVGLLLNVLAIRTEFSGRQSFRELLQVQKQELLQAYQHRSYPLDKLLDKLPYALEPSRSPLFDIMLVLHNQATLSHLHQPSPDASLPGVAVTPYQELPRESSQFDMAFGFSYTPDGQGLSLALEYNTGLFSDWFARQLASHFIALAEQVVTHLDTPIETLDLLSAAERQLLAGPGPLPAPEPAPTSAVWGSWLANWENDTPEATAVASGRQCLSYRELAAEVRRTAHYLREAKGVRPGDRVGVMLDPSAWLPVAMLSIWMAGGVYVPINPAYPEARKQLIIADAECRLVLTATECLESAGYSAGASLAWQPWPTAYLLYTSGTTGRPKGVAVGHAALADKLQVELELLGLAEPVHTILLTNYSFDVSLLELLLPLLSGGKLVIPDPQLLLQPQELAGVLAQEQVRVLQGTPTFIETFCQHLSAPLCASLARSLRVCCIGGESLNKKLVELLKSKLPTVRLNNHYGPTEAVIDAVVNQDVRHFERNIIGRPLKNTRAFVLDKQRHCVPAGVIGELYIGGASLAEGYVNLPQETREKFVDSPFAAGEKLYKTGDLVKWDHALQLEFIGRVDEQVKIRGLRIELEEIRRVLEQAEQVQQAAVFCHQYAGQPQVLAFLLMPAAALDTAGIKQYLRTQLPDYMVPSVLTRVEHIPLNKNGKVDKTALLAQVDVTAGSTERVAATTETQRMLVQLWEELLGRPQPGITDNFFDVGGNSMLLMKLRIALQQTFGVQLSIKELFKLVTIAQLAEALEVAAWLQTDYQDITQELTEEFTI
ncbi:amino acid adenylation domain-containing protein [Hymenobacter sp. HSC-4F20]|uniref:non-ribosomal peptide synthetase n=1 Tax=Hymenobacter sp. HSC-4F20 TaxID=2864135 RepID=UPI001C72F4C3|nr:non-ribosomal peptide synthetase [Hymenobacter sp. HSC-4F20]MBX0292998.1 amino acid adenylation domain-containing protein [Hymenobacter sp. HSC-4F20]